jgi:hypothetical protein
MFFRAPNAKLAGGTFEPRLFTRLFPMSRTVFWSWQSDAPPRETRNIIHDALKSSLADLAAELEEAERLEVDQGAKGVVGLNLIAEVILDKIDTSVAIVADITTVAVIGDGLERKCVPNPNVMLELGYARRSRGRGRIIPVQPGDRSHAL